MARLRTVIGILAASAMLALGVFLIAKELFGAERMAILKAFAAAGLAGLGGLWVWGASGSGRLGVERD